MNKKILILLSIFISLASIMIIAIWGTLPENTNLPPIDSITILDVEEVNDEGDKLINVSGVITPLNTIHTIRFEISPLVSNMSGIIVTSSETTIKILVSISGGYVNVYYDTEAINKKRAVTITITDQNTLITDNVTLWFKPDDVIVIPD